MRPSDPNLGSKELSRYERLRSEAYNFRNRWELMAPFVAPSRVGIITHRYPGMSETIDVYDSTAMFAADLLAKFIQGSVTPASSKWFTLRAHDDTLNEDHDTREWLDEAQNIMHLSLNRSNFYAEVFEMYVDYGGFGTGGLSCMEAMPPPNRNVRGFRGLRFEAYKTGRYVLAEDAQGMVDTKMSEFKMNARAAADKFGAENLSESLKVASASQPDQMFNFIHSVRPRAMSEQSQSAKGKPWASIYVEYDSKKVVHESGFDDFGHFFPRWVKTPNEVYGRSPGEFALPDTRSLNRAKQLGLEDHALKVRPPVLGAHGSVIGGTLRLRPAAFTAVRTNGQRVGDMIQPFQTGSNPEITNIKEEELRKSIRQIYFVDQILEMLSMNKVEMTATEVLKKIELLNRVLGPVYGRLQSEFMQPMVDRVFDLMWRSGALPPPPPAVQQYGAELDVEFESPLAKAQRGGEIEAIQMLMNDVAPLVQADPSVMDIFDTDEAAQYMAEIRGVPARVLRSQKAIDAIRQKRSEDQQNEQAQREMEATTQGIKNVTPLIQTAAQSQAA